MSRYYYERTPVLRVSCSEIIKNDRAKLFADMLVEKTFDSTQEQIEARINSLRQKVK